MKLNKIKETLNSVFEEDESLKYALATNLAKYGRPQSKKSDKPAKLTKSLEKKREKNVKDLKKSMDEQSVFDNISIKDLALEIANDIKPWLADDVNPSQPDLQMTIQAILGQLQYKGLNEDKADAIRWFGNLKYYYQKAFKELQGEDRETYKQLAKDFFSKLEIDDKVRPVGLDEDKGTLNKIADMLDRKFPDLRFDVNTMADRIDVRGSQQDLANFGRELHGEKIFDYEVFHTDDDDRGEIVRIVRSDKIMRNEEYKVAGRTVKLNKGKNPNGTDWTVTFPNGKTTSLADVLALIDPLPGLTKEDKKKADRCLRIARRKMPQSSAYRSGLIVKCRKGMIWKKEK